MAVLIHVFESVVVRFEAEDILQIVTAWREQ
jgi:hypothetical protein